MEDNVRPAQKIYLIGDDGKETTDKEGGNHGTYQMYGMWKRNIGSGSSLSQLRMSYQTICNWRASTGAFGNGTPDASHAANGAGCSAATKKVKEENLFLKQCSRSSHFYGDTAGGNYGCIGNVGSYNGIDSIDLCTDPGFAGGDICVD